MKINVTNHLKEYAAYTVSLVDGSMWWAGFAPVVDMMIFEGMPPTQGGVVVNIILQHEDYRACFMAAMDATGSNMKNKSSLHEQLKALEKRKQPKGRILCIDTGEFFDTAAAVSRKHAVAPSNLSNHLNGSAGYKTVNGMTFRKVFS